MKASELLLLLESTIKHHGDYQVLIEHCVDGWPDHYNVSSVSVEEIEGNQFTIINEEEK